MVEEPALSAFRVLTRCMWQNMVLHEKNSGNVCRLYINPPYAKRILMVVFHCQPGLWRRVCTSIRACATLIYCFCFIYVRTHEKIVSWMVTGVGACQLLSNFFRFLEVFATVNSTQFPSRI